ncbi:hypothetical protein PTW37_16360 (plasmid) [Arthrobacter agilis]|uniref:hypothetical protein n=1 Tax=Arthrobacter agilis TaxID=37921 RepID=UPI0023662EDA|nr:hypothetical protein [Arthrobacter agilis]WDF35077.1 hypothetical protein PTW37_16360 [Arthrobacter agilis]
MSTSTIRGSYPHPVLDSSDDVAAVIEVFNPTFGTTVDDVEVRFQVRMTDPQIRQLIEDGHARYSFRWSCSSTIANGDLYARVADTYADSTGYVGWIDQLDIRDVVKIEVKIIATQPIEGYALDRQHTEYGGASFNLQSGDVLADGGSFEIEPGKLYDPLRPPVGSCFRFVSDKTMSRGLQIRFDYDDQVLVLFPERVLTGFGLLKENPDLQIGLVVLPALMETISFIKRNRDAEATGQNEDLSGKQWYTAISQLVEDLSSFEVPAFEAAQKILGQPLDAAITSKLTEQDQEDTDD